MARGFKFSTPTEQGKQHQKVSYSTLIRSYKAQTDKNVNARNWFNRPAYYGTSSQVGVIHDDYDKGQS